VVGNFLSAKIGWTFDRRISLDYEGCATIGRTGNDTDFLAVRFKVGIKRWPRTYVRRIQRSGEDGFHRGRACIVGEPLNLDVRAQALFKPAFALPRKSVSDYALRMSDVRKMPESNRRLLLRSRKVRKEKTFQLSL